MEGGILLMMLFSAVLSLLFTLVIASTLRGSRFSFVIKIAILILISNVASLLLWFMFFTIEYFSGWETATSIFLLFISDTSFGLAHWTLANKYYTVASEIPVVLQKRHAEATCCNKDLTNSTVVVLIIIMAFAECMFLGLHVKYERFLILTQVSIFLNVCLLLFIGSVMLASVIKIRRFLSSNDNVVNINQLLVHASCFGIFVLAELFNVIVVSFDSVTNTSCQVILCRDDYFFVVAANFLSQILLSMILFKLGSKDADEQSNSLDFQDINVIECDEDAELQARIWNMFAKLKDAP